MTADRDDPQAADGGAPAGGEQRADIDRAFVRLTLWQTILSVVGVVIATIALYAALNESAEMRRQTAAAVWPFPQLRIEDYADEDDARFSLSLRNVGVGPARIRAFRLEIEGRAVTDWTQAAAVFGHQLGENVTRDFIADRVLSPGETVQLIGVTDAALARALQATVRNGKSSVTYCYCSIFDECWLADSRGDLQAPEPVSACPDFGSEAFRR